MVEYYNELLYYIMKKVSNKDYAQDIVQEAYTKVISIQNQDEISNKRAFLYKVAKNIIIDKARKNKIVNEVSYNENIASITNEVEDIVLAENRQKVLMLELNKLPDKRKEAFVLYVIEGYDKETIASIMCISHSAVAKHISRASIELKEKIKKKENEI